MARRKKQFGATFDPEPNRALRTFLAIESQTAVERAHLVVELANRDRCAEAMVNLKIADKRLGSFIAVKDSYGRLHPAEVVQQGYKAFHTVADAAETFKNKCLK